VTYRYIYVVEIPLIELFKSKYIKLKTRCPYLVHMGLQYVISVDTGNVYKF